MKLSAIVDLIVSTLTLSPEKWNVGLVVTPIAALDPVTAFRAADIGVFIMPEMVQINLDESARRTKVMVLAKAKYVTIAVTKKLESVDNTGVDVTTWEEAKQVIDLKEAIDDFLLRHDWAPHLKIVDVETGPPSDIEMESRYFLSSTQIGFEVIECDTEHVSSSSLRGSLRESRSARRSHSTNSLERLGRLAGPQSE